MANVHEGVFSKRWYGINDTINQKFAITHDSSIANRAFEGHANIFRKKFPSVWEAINIFHKTTKW